MDAAGCMLYASESVNNLILGVSERLVREPNAYQNPFFGVVEDDDGCVILAAVMTPPHNLILGGIEDFEPAVSTLVAHFQEHPIAIPGVIGPKRIAAQFVKVWLQKRKQAARISMRQKVYECRSVHLPLMPLGRFRLAVSADAPVIGEYVAVFELETLGRSGEIDPDRATRLVEEGKVFVWEHEGVLVSMATRNRPLAHSITVSGVYTPPAHRRKGYATALVARLSQYLLDSGYQFVNLFTDLANPISNSIYQKIGYCPVCDFIMYTFVQGEASKG